MGLDLLTFPSAGFPFCPWPPSLKKRVPSKEDRPILHLGTWLEKNGKETDNDIGLVHGKGSC